MRDTEFRIWDKERCKYFYFDTIDLIYPLFSVRTFVFPLLKSGVEKERNTGLRDCKRTEEYPEGQKIFEGDIVSVKRKQVNGSLHKFVVEWDNMKAGFYLTPIHRYPKDQESYLRNEFINAKNKSVIGNIHEGEGNE